MKPVMDCIGKQLPKNGQQKPNLEMNIGTVGAFIMGMKNSTRVSVVLKGSLTLLGVFLLPALGQAHPGIPGHAHGFSGGLVHPLSGLDHILAMIAVGLWAAQRGGRAIWAIPLAFVSVMALGGLLGMTGGLFPFAEVGIVASVLILGLLIAARIRLPLSESVLIVGLFALFHGYAHGMEMPAMVTGLDFGIGFLLATAALHLCGVSLGLVAKQQGSMQMVRYLGVGIAVSGLYLCFTSL
jgi:urease accessory protein